MKQKLPLISYISTVSGESAPAFIDMDKDKKLTSGIGPSKPVTGSTKPEDNEDPDSEVSLNVPDIDEDYYIEEEETAEDLARRISEMGFDVEIRKTEEIDPNTIVKKEPKAKEKIPGITDAPKMNIPTTTSTPPSVVATARYTFPNMDKIRYGAQHYATISDGQTAIKPSVKITIDDGVAMSPDANTLMNVLLKYGISGRISSALRPGAKTSSGKTSFHALGQAVDIAAPAGMSMEQFTAQFNNPELIKELSALGFNILDETNPDMMKRTGATGPHFHIGRDKVTSSKFGGTFRHSNPFK